MDEAWKEKVLRLAYSGSEQGELEYVALVDQVDGKVTLEIAHVLLQTFSDEPDYGVQESVVRVLANADQEVYMQALLEELPRLQREAPEWAEDLLSHAIDSSENALLKVARHLSVQTMLREAILRFSLQQHTCNGQNILEALVLDNL